MLRYYMYSMNQKRCSGKILKAKNIPTINLWSEMNAEIQNNSNAFQMCHVPVTFSND